MYITWLSDTARSIRSLSNCDNETPEQKRERILADSRKISMPIRPVGRPRKGAADRYKEAEIACQRNVHLTAHNNVFDLEQEEIVKIGAPTDLTLNSEYQNFDSVPLVNTIETATNPQSGGQELLDTKGT